VPLRLSTRPSARPLIPSKYLGTLSCPPRVGGAARFGQRAGPVQCLHQRGHRDAVHAGAVTIAFNSTTCVIKWADGSRTVCAGGTRARAIKMN